MKGTVHANVFIYEVKEEGERNIRMAYDFKLTQADIFPDSNASFFCSVFFLQKYKNTHTRFLYTYRKKRRMKKDKL